MPKVAGKKYPYTKSGKAQAARAKKRIKKSAMESAKKKKAGRSMNKSKKKK